MPSDYSSPTPSISGESLDLTTQNAALKRRLAATQAELETTKGSKPKKSASDITLGRGIRRLATLFEAIHDVIGEADRRTDPEGFNAFDSDLDEDKKRSQDRTYQAYKLLLVLVPKLQLVLDDPDEECLPKFESQLQKGSNDARSDDVRRIKEELAGWLNASYSPSTPFSGKDRDGRGLQNDITGGLLCPIMYDWGDMEVRANIRNSKPGYFIAGNYFLRCLYPQGKGDPENVEHHFLRSGLLVKTFCCIFTSPTSSESFDDETEDGPARKKQKTRGQKRATKSNVASLLHMDGRVTPRSIAYAATLLIFNLTDSTQWVDTYNGFSLQTFYNFIVDYFEDVPDATTKQHVDDLLKWWNRQVFPNQDIAASDSRESRNILAVQRARAIARGRA